MGDIISPLKIPVLCHHNAVTWRTGQLCAKTFLPLLFIVLILTARAFQCLWRGFFCVKPTQSWNPYRNTVNASDQLILSLAITVQMGIWKVDLR